jgi:hypothetical protein
MTQEEGNNCMGIKKNSRVQKNCATLAGMNGGMLTGSQTAYNTAASDGAINDGNMICQLIFNNFEML